MRKAKKCQRHRAVATIKRHKRKSGERLKHILHDRYFKQCRRYPRHRIYVQIPKQNYEHIYDVCNPCMRAIKGLADERKIRMRVRFGKG